MTPKYLHCSSKTNALCGAYTPSVLGQGCMYRSQCAVYLERVAGEAKRQLGKNVTDLIKQDELDRLAEESMVRCRSEGR